MILTGHAVAAEEVEKAGAGEAIKLQPVEVVGEKVELLKGKVSRERLEDIQPVDIGDLLKKDVEGIAAIRRSGVALDPVLRGMSKDRLNILIDGGLLYGACANRMDPPTFHVTPYAVESVEVLRGPFDVTKGPGSLGGIINIKTKEPAYYEKTEIHPEIRAGYDGVSNGLKGGLTVQGGKAPFGFNISYDYKGYDGYEDGHGKRITTDFKQSNYVADLYYFIDRDSTAGLSYMGQRAKDVFYPTLAMDSPKDDMDMTALSVDLKNPAQAIKRLEARVYSSWVNHSMDNFSKFSYANPAPTMRMEAPSESRTYGGKIKATLDLLDGMDAGIDYYNRRWDITLKRWSLAGMAMPDIRSIPDTVTTDFGLFVQPSKRFGKLTLTGGARMDFVNAEARAVGTAEQGYFNAVYGPETSSHLDRSETNAGAFLKGTYGITGGVDLYGGIGRGVRTADPRERFRILLPIPGNKRDIGNPNLEPEESLQFEVGSRARLGRFNYDLSFFYNSVKNYIVQYDTGITSGSFGVLPNWPVMGYRNVDAALYGGEISAGFLATENISLFGSASYTRGENMDEKKPLPEIMPLQGRLGLRYDEISGKFWAELTGRVATHQHRYDPVVDPGTTPGFTTFDVRLGWRPAENILLTAGVENIFDRYYYEHTSKNFALNQDGYTANDRIPEPGRNAYLNASWMF